VRGRPLAWHPYLDPDRGTGPDGLWTKDDTGLAGLARTAMRSRPGTGATDAGPLLKRLRAQRLEPLAKALGASTDGLPPARRPIVLPSRTMAGIPIETLLAPDDTRTVSYAPSATLFKYLREQPRPDRHAGLLALGDPVYERADSSAKPKSLPDHGLLVNMVAPGSNAAPHGLKPGDVLLAYNGMGLHLREDLKAVPEPGQPVPVEVWRAGQVARRELAPGKLGVVFDTCPAPVAIAEQRKLQKVLVAARSGDEDFAPLPGTRYEVQALAQLFQSDDRPTTALFGADASEPELDRRAASSELGRFGFIHLDAAVLCQLAGSTHRAFGTVAQGPRRSPRQKPGFAGELVTKSPSWRRAYRAATRGRRERRGGRGRARTERCRRSWRRPSLRPGVLLGCVCAGG